jgi:hypothetical protein
MRKKGNRKQEKRKMSRREKKKENAKMKVKINVIFYVIPTLISDKKFPFPKLFGK